MKRILLTGAGCPGWYSVYTELSKKDCEIYSCDSSNNTSGAQLSHGHEIVPYGDDPSYIKVIKKIILKNKIDIIIPFTDPELFPLAKSKKDLKKIGCQVLVSEYRDLKNILDKTALYEGLPTISPKFSYIKTEKDIIKFIGERSDGSSCFIKLSSAYGSRGTKKVVSDLQWVEGFSNKKPEEFGMTFPVSCVNKIKEKIVVLETLPGEEYSIDCVFSDNGSLQFYGVRERETTKNGICHTAKFAEDTSQEFLAFINKISNFVKMKYHINIQTKRDAQGNLKLLEINPRLSGSIGAFLNTGYPLLDISISNNEFPIKTPKTYKYRHAYRVSHFIK